MMADRHSGGNLGLNSKFKASDTAPLRMYVNDFDGNGTVEQIITSIDKDGRERLFATKDELATDCQPLTKISNLPGLRQGRA